MRKFLITAFAVLTSFSAVSQDFSNLGKDFYLCFPSHVESSNLAQMQVYITSPYNSSGVVSYNGVTQPFTVTANQITTIDISRAAAYISPAESNSAVNKGIRVKTDAGQPSVVVYTEIFASARTEATLVLPVNVLGKKYRAISYWQASTGGSQSQFQIIAVEPNTNVQIQLFRNGVISGAPFTVSLPNVGDVYQIQDPSDLSGSYIESIAGGLGGCQRIAVFSGSSAVQISGTSCNGTSYDPLMQQCYPVSTWGKSFGVVPFAENNNGYHARVMASEDNTQVQYGATNVTLNAGEVYPAPALHVTPQTQPMAIKADKPISVSQYMMSQNCAGSTRSDPDMVILNPVEQNISDITIFTSNHQNIDRQYMNVLVPTSGRASLTVKNAAGTSLPVAGWVTMPGNPFYSYLQYQFPTPASNSSYRIQCDSGFNAICYGLANVETYSYSAGTNIRDLSQQLGVNTQYGIESSPSVCSGSPFRFKVSFPATLVINQMDWDLTNVPLTPAGGFITVGPTPPPTIDSTTTVNGKLVNWYSLPGLYTCNTPGNYSITITNHTAGSDNCGSVQDNDFPLDVYAPPSAAFHTSTARCVGSPISFFNDIPILPKPTYKWYWDFGDATTSNLQNPVHTYAAPGNYTVRFSAITTPGCLSDTVTQVVGVSNVPNAQFTVVAPVCEGAPVRFVDNSSLTGTPGVISQWSWNFGDATPVVNAGTGADQLHVYATYGDKIPSLVATTNTGCASNPFNVNPLHINPKPVANFTPPAGICLPASNSQFTSTSSIAEPSIAVYYWNFGDPASGINNTSSVTNPTHTYNSTGPFTIKLAVTSAAGCVSDTAIKVLSTIYAQPHGLFTVPPPVCLGTPMNFTSSSDPLAGNTILEYHWDFGEPSNAGNNTSTLANPSHTYLTLGTGTFTVKHWIVTDKGCYSDTSVQIVTVNPVPVISSTSHTNPTVCTGADGSITLNGLIPGTTYTVKYERNNVAQPILTLTADAAGVVIIPGLNAGTYSNISCAANGCTSLNPPTEILTDPNPPAAPTPGSNGPICSGTTLNLSASTIAGASAYTWTGPNSFSSTSQNPSIPAATTAAAGVYTVTATVNNCTSAPSVNLTVVVNLTPSITSITKTDPTTCSGTEGTITINGLTAGQTFTVNYQKNGAPQTPVSLTANASGSVTITGLAAGTYSNINCTASGCTSANGATQVLTDPAPPNAPTAGYNSPVCSGTTLSLTATPNSPGTTTYNWSGPGGFTSSLQNPSIASVTVAQSGTYQVFATVNNCISLVAGTVNVNIIQSPVISTINKTDPTTCTGTEGTITINGLVAGQTYTVNYSKNGTAQTPLTLTANAAGSVTITSLGAGSYTNINVTYNGCTSANGPAQVLSDPNPPLAPTASGSTPICSGTTLTLNAVPNSAGATTYTWTGPNSFSSTSQNPTIPLVTTAATGIYTVTATVNNCVSGTSNNVNIQVNLTPDISSVSFSNPTTCSGSDGTVTLNGLTAGTTFTVNYKKNGTAQTPLTLTANASGSVTITGLSAGTYSNINCTASSCTGADAPTQVLTDPNPPAQPTGSTITSPVCEGQTLSFSTPAVAGAIYTWTGPNAFNSSLQNPSISNATPAATGNYSIVVTVNNCVSQAFIIPVTVNANPTAVITNSTPVCENNVITFTDASVPNSGVVNGWSWNFGDPASGANNTSTLQNPVHTFSGLNNYNVTLTVTTDKGCSSTQATKNITVNVNPKAGFMVPEVCLNDVDATFTDTSSIPSGSIVNWSWDFGDPGSGALNFQNGAVHNGVHKYTATGNYTVKLTVTSNTGCTNFISHDIFINGANPTANFTVANAAAICSNDSVSITNLSTVAPGVVTKLEIFWDNVNAPLPSGTEYVLDDNPTPGKIYKHKYASFQSPLTKNYTIRMRAYSGTLCVNDKLVVITVNATPKVQFNNMPDVCYDAAPFQITQASEIGGVPGTGTFSGPGVSPTGIFNPTAAGIGTFTIKYTYASTAAGCIDSMSKTIRVLDSATAKFIVTPPVCETKSVSFTEASTAPAGVTLTNTVFDFGDGSPLQNQAPGSTFTHTYAAAGNYTVTMYNTSSAGCKSTSATTVVHVNPQARPNFTFPASVCLPNASVLFTNTSSIADGTENSFTYLWNFGDPASGANNTSVAKNPTHVYTTQASYSVKLEVVTGAGCYHDTTIVFNNIHPQPKADFTISNPGGVCIGDPVTFTDITNPLDGTTVSRSWDLGDGSLRSAPSVTYTYGVANTFNVKLFITNSQGCNSDTMTKAFTVHPYPTVDAGPDRYILEGGTITLQPVVSGNDLQYLWLPATFLNNNAIATPNVVKPTTDMTYTLLVTARGGCSRSDNVFVKLLKFPVIPNTFTPNNDGINDLWSIDYLDTYPGNRVQVFNRYGQLVFESYGYSKPWDGTYNGKALPVGTYYYIIEPKNGRTPLTGYVTIIK